MKSFVRFLLTHSGHRDLLNRISIPDLYASVLVEWWQLAGVLDTPGRLQVFDMIKQRDFVEMKGPAGGQKSLAVTHISELTRPQSSRSDKMGSQ